MPTTAKSLIAKVLCLSLAALSVLLMFAAPVYAQSLAEPPTPPAPTGVRAWRLERTWLRQQRVYDRLGFFFDHTQQRLDQAQALIDRAEANGKDVAGLQAALVAFSASIQEARPVYESAKGLVASHKGFDASGSVEDPALAAQTVDEMGQKLRDIRDILVDPARALRDAIRAFREANRPH